ncbi:uncharacterized protein K02A2.6-like [Octopus sinensis]|uniref:Uncharacterized protein K02A2.6-like n=1 Tax=Octopus sinensis TaxID=2607531 RepID=A0A6P7SA91_9MOLL|nr:uncharacterized protein K02A2.6-like [Octopus sinensis]
MSFGLQNATSTFQCFIDEVVRGLDFVFAYVDDIFTASDTHENHLQHLSQLFQRLRDYGVHFNPDKCVFGQSSLDFLGHCIDSSGIKPLSSKADAIQRIAPPSSLRQLRHFLDLDSWTHVFVRDDSVKGPLVSPYKGPFCVLSSTPKIFELDINGRLETVSVDHLKRAYFEVSPFFDDTTATTTFESSHAPLTTPPLTHAPLSTPTLATPPSSLQPASNKPYVTRSGRTVHWPKKLSKTIYV